MGEIRARGAGAVAFLDGLITNDLARIAVGQAVYTCCCREDGNILDDLILYKHADDDVLVVCNASNHDKIWAHLSARAVDVPSLSLEDESSQTALLAVQGPVALAILERLDPSLAGLGQELGPFRLAHHTLFGHRVTIARTGYTGEDGVELFVSNEGAGPLWDALLEVGGPLGLVPAGLGCRDTLRLEARLSLYGNEIDETTNPLEAGLAWTVKFGKTDFVGKAALVAIRERGLARRIVGFEMTERGSARQGYAFLDEQGKTVGRCTSGGPSPSLGKAIGLGYLPLEMSEVGSRFSVDCRGKTLGAVVVPTPFYKRP
jgi:aminomethyltransferase